VINARMRRAAELDDGDDRDEGGRSKRWQPV
jgi:hypothetical protein